MEMMEVNQSFTSITPITPSRPSSQTGGECRIRTCVGIADGFTVRSHWPLGQLPSRTKMVPEMIPEILCSPATLTVEKSRQVEGAGFEPARL